jgi:hypothetical protein
VVEMANIKLNAGEVLIKENMANCIISKMSAKQGTLFLTSERLVFHKRSMFSYMLVGVFSYLSKGKFDFDIPLTAISAVIKAKHGFNSKVFCIKTADNKEYKFVVKFDDWFEALQNTYIAYMQIRLTEDGEKRWIIK